MNLTKVEINVRSFPKLTFMDTPHKIDILKVLRYFF